MSTVDTVADGLDDDPFDDDLADQLAARAPRRFVNRTTVVLAGLALTVTVFVAGAQVQKHFGQPVAAASSSAGGGQNAAAARAGQRGANQANGGANAGNATGNGQSGAATTGTVKLVDGTTVYITTPDGQVLTVRTDGSTQVQLTQPGTVKDLAVGATVTITGRSTDASTMTASRITKDR
jgi:hypothetical protein